MQNDASHLSYGEIKHTQVKKNKNMKFWTLNCPESGQISSYRGLRGTIRRRKTRSFFWEGSQGAKKPSKGQKVEKTMENVKFGRNKNETN